jgi:hypothetical protein
MEAQLSSTEVRVRPCRATAAPGSLGPEVTAETDATPQASADMRHCKRGHPSDALILKPHKFAVKPVCDRQGNRLPGRRTRGLARIHGAPVGRMARPERWFRLTARLISRKGIAAVIPGLGVITSGRSFARSMSRERANRTILHLSRKPASTPEPGGRGSAAGPATRRQSRSRAGSRRNHEVVLVRADSLRPLEHLRLSRGCRAGFLATMGGSAVRADNGR